MTRDRLASKHNASAPRHLWAILQPPKFEKIYRIYVQAGSGLQAKPLLVTATYEAWQFENPIDALNWLEQRLHNTSLLI
jgi:hypothetical protein